MKITEVSAALQGIVSDIPNTYFMRATSQDANIELDQISLRQKTVVIFNNLPTINNTIGAGGYVSQEFPIELQVLKLDQVDEKTDGSDMIRDTCSIVANTIFDRLNGVFTNQLTPIENYELNYLGEAKIYDDVFTGVRLRFTILLNRDVYYCD